MLMFRSEPIFVTPLAVFTVRLFKVAPKPVAKRIVPERPVVAFITTLERVLPVKVPEPVAAISAAGFKVKV